MKEPVEAVIEVVVVAVVVAIDLPAAFAVAVAAAPVAMIQFPILLRQLVKVEYLKCCSIHSTKIDQADKCHLLEVMGWLDVLY